MRKLLSTLMTVVLGVGWFIWLRPTQFNGSATYVIVTGKSMEPTLYAGDLVILRHRERYVPGDIVAYLIRGGNILHRITGVTGGGSNADDGGDEVVDEGDGDGDGAGDDEGGVD